MADRISACISVLGVLATSLLLVGAVREYQAGSSAWWVGAGVVFVLAACFTLVRDVRRLRAPAPNGRKS
ncbi:hypothetical protein AB0K02_03505 [Streptomyces sp. NPDC049597]|uniref:hypothetical protein n=1 Tax=Streptomyces sp. NPDC049597 TaxID=3155276 RepID=UPI003423DCD6